jgi:multicomponent Na+:H+ antiporter subunit G
MWWIYIFILAGSLFILIASIGLLRFKDIYSRMHVTTKASSFGIMLILLGVSFYLNIGEVYLKAFFVILFVYLTAPLAAHSIAKSNKDKS